MKTNLDIVNELTETLKGLLPIDVEYQERLNKKFRLEFNYNSNHLEGNTLSYNETELLLIFDDTKGNHSMREYEEMKAHDTAFQLIQDWAKNEDYPLTESDIKTLNKIILVRPFWKNAVTYEGQPTNKEIIIGEYKRHPNSVRLQNGEIFHYSSPTDTPVLMHELIEWYRDEVDGLHPVTLAAMFHYKLARIHPFDDGNGRIARLLLNYILLRNDLPPIVIRSDDKSNYLRAIHAADVGDNAPFIDYVAEQLIWSLQLAIKAANKESIDDVNDWKKELELLKRELPKEEDVKAKRDVQNSSQVALKVLLPLFEKILLEMEQFYVMFDSHEISLKIGMAGHRITEKSQLQDLLLTVAKENNGVEMEIYLRGFTKNGINIFDASTRIQCELEPYRYTITHPIGTRFQKIKLYHEILTEHEEQQIIAEMAKQIIEDIKNRRKIK